MPKYISRITTILVVLLVAGLAAGLVSARMLADDEKTRHGGLSRVLVFDGSPVHNVGELQLHTGNWGGVGSWPGSTMPFSDAPSAMWPAGSGVEYLFAGGLWVGGIVAGVPRVSTAAFELEFRPTESPVDYVYRAMEGAWHGNRLPSTDADDDRDGLVDEDPLDGHDNDNDGKIDEDFAAISTQMFSRWYTDDQPISQQIYPQHNPLHIMVREHSYQWDHDDFDDFVGFDYVVTNTGNDIIEDVIVGMLVDADAGPRGVDNYWNDDATAFVNDRVRDTEHGPVMFDYSYVYDLDGDGGVTTGYFGLVILDHPTDETGETAPTQVGVSTYVSIDNCGGFDCIWDPTSDFERYEMMSWGTIDRDKIVPRDYRVLVCIGPFKELLPGETLKFSTALVATPRDSDFENVANAVVAYQGEFFDVDGDPSTGEDGREYQAHWWLPGQEIPKPAVTADVKVVPQTLNLKSNGKGLHAHVVLPKGYDAADVDESSLRLQGTIPGEIQSIAGKRKLIIRFPRKRLQEVAQTGMMDVTVSGMVGDTKFSGTDQIRVIGGDGPRPDTGTTPVAMTLSHSPNPFNPSARIAFELPRNAEVTLEVFSVDGRRVRELVDGVLPAGRHDVTWHGRDDRGNAVASGIYFYRLRAGDEMLTRRMVLVK